ncbi:dCMP deaminase family protein [candidate division KSB1 bacterium]|nr:dCMP deaminase family protein [candidate division KSB1 bacterium]
MTANQTKRTDYLSWDEYFMGIALLSAQRSKDPNTQVGACIVNDHKKVVGVGYNGFPTGCSDESLPWAREGDFLETKYPYVCHAELNAILNSIGENLYGCVIYVALFPCNECAKAIIQSGIKEVVYLSDKYAETDSIKASKTMFEQAGVKMRQLVMTRESITISFSDSRV